eukprot:1160460-Pelagomonas_calceolata.AAC.4
MVKSSGKPASVFTPSNPGCRPPPVSCAGHHMVQQQGKAWRGVNNKKRKSGRWGRRKRGCPGLQVLRG